MKYAVKAKVSLAIIIIALLAASAAFLMHNPGLISPKPEARPQIRLDQAEVLINGFKFAKNDGTGQNWQVVAKRARMKKDTEVTNLEDMEATYNAKNGDVLKLKADNGIFDSRTKHMKAIGTTSREVVVTSSKGYIMTSPSLAWDGNKKELTTDDRVTLTGKNIKIVGKGMIARSDLQEVWITHGVKTTFTQSR